MWRSLLYIVFNLFSFLADTHTCTDVFRHTPSQRLRSRTACKSLFMFGQIHMCVHKNSDTHPQWCGTHVDLRCAMQICLSYCVRVSFVLLPATNKDLPQQKNHNTLSDMALTCAMQVCPVYHVCMAFVFLPLIPPAPPTRCRVSAVWQTCWE